MPTSVLKKRFLCGIKKRHVTLYATFLILGVVSKICKIFDKVVTTTDMVRSQTMNFCETLLNKPTPAPHVHYYMAMPAIDSSKNKCGMMFDSNSFDIEMDLIASAYMTPQQFHFDYFEEVPLRQCSRITGS